MEPASTNLSYPRHFHHGLYEVHLPVTDLDRAVEFYVEKLGFEFGFGASGGSSALLLYTEERKRWMLGLFRVETVVHRSAAEYHVSFRVDEEHADGMVPWLRDRGIEPIHPPRAPVQGPMSEPIVHGWMPAAAVFFQDPDGHLLELIAELSDAPRPDLLYHPLSEWRALVGRKA
ncbi:MAG TPA: VOC family protein [Chthoniobacterales bacterium]|nr:VOC family protein [Chthoniobacterales bacterium]